MGKLLAAAGLAAGAWLWMKGPKDPRRWPAALAEELARVRRQAEEALAAGRLAAIRREAEIDREIDEATRI